MKANLKDFEYKNLTYSYNNNLNKFESNYERDLQLFIIWSKARTKEEEILQDLDQNFNIIACIDNTWSEKHLDDNFHRIYDVAPTGGKAGKREEVGDGAFVVVVIEDLEPKYEYRSDASGRFKIVNANVVDKKRLFRKWVGGSYMVHSTDNLMEFFNNAVLLFGKDTALQLLGQPARNNKCLKTNNDLVGASGWNSCEELFEVLNLTTEYVVLRGADKLQDTVKTLSGDVDILCSNIGEFTAAANAVNIWNSKNFYHVNVDGKNVLFDIRYVGDGYFDEKWQKDILDKKVMNHEGIYTPRVDDYFFSHLYHAYVHKPYFYKKYMERLTGLSEKIGIKNFKTEFNNTPTYILDMLRGYLAAHNYDASIPNDEKVYLNIKFLSRLKKINYVRLYLRVFKVKVKGFPEKVLSFIKRLLKKNDTLFNVLFNIRAKFNKLINR